MKVLFLARSGLYSHMSGEIVQIENTAAALKKLGVEVDSVVGSSFDPVPYDLVHIFQLDWNLDSFYQAKTAKKFNKKVVLSAIHHNINEVKKYDDIYAFDLRRILRSLSSDQFKRDEMKELYRSMFFPKLLPKALYSIFYGLKNMYISVLKNSDMVLVQSEAEARDLRETFGVEIKYQKIQNGVSDQFLDTDNLSNPLSIENYIICVGRIEPRKNQLSIIEAVMGIREQTKKNIQLVLIGKTSNKKHFEYNTKINKLISENKWIVHLEKVPHKQIPAYYKYAKVCVSASWFETTGLTSLEALFCGTNAVAAGERAKESLGDLVSYCQPESTVSIYDAILKEMDKPRPKLSEEFKRSFTWDNAAKEILKIYNQLL